jgi:dCTP deaminase
MILTGKEIIQEINSQNITIKPFTLKQVNPNSYNYRLSEYIAIPTINKEQTIVYKTVRIPEYGILIEAGSTYLSHTYEELGSKRDIVCL